MSQELENRTVLVIGRASGIAHAVTLAARAAGARVVVAGRNADSYGEPAETVDLTDEASVAALAARVRPDHVVSTASARARGAIGDLAPETVLASFSTKVIGPLLLAKHFAAHLPADGSFVFFSGASALRPTVGMLAVAATNGAVDVLVKGLAVELAPIRVNAIAPGTIDTGAYDALGAEGKAALFARRAELNPARRIGTAQDVADAVLFALRNSFLTGVSLPVDGGEAVV